MSHGGPEPNISLPKFSGYSLRVRNSVDHSNIECPMFTSRSEYFQNHQMDLLPMKIT